MSGPTNLTQAEYAKMDAERDEILARLGVPPPEDSWARVELWRWQYGTLPTPDDMRPLDVAYGMAQMAKALDQPMRRGANMPMTCNVAAVLRYAAKLISANTTSSAAPV